MITIMEHGDRSDITIACFVASSRCHDHRSKRLWSIQKDCHLEAAEQYCQPERPSPRFCRSIGPILSYFGQIGMVRRDGTWAGSCFSL